MKSNKFIYLITPSWLIRKKSDFTKGTSNLKNLGFSFINNYYISKLNNPQKKAEEIHKAFRNKKSDIILAQRGGYSSIKILPFLNFKLIKANPRIFAGFSDITSLLNIINEKTGLITLHSPMLLNFSKSVKFTANSFLNAINGFPKKELFKNASVKIYKPGIAKGKLKGGNLITLTSLLGTKWETKIDNAILFLEDVDEKIHSIDRCLTQWILKGKFSKIKGLILGDFRGIKTKEVYEMISSQIKVRFPVVSCPYIGHVDKKITLPVGANVTLNTFKKSLFIDKL